MAASVDGLTHVGVVAAAVAAATAALVCSMFAQAPAKLSPTKQNKPSSSECGARGTEQWVLPVRPKPTAPYPDIKRAGGFLFLAGASNREPSTGTADSGYFVGVQEMANGEVRYDVEAQTHRVIQALSEALALADHSLADLVKVNVYLVEAADIPAFNTAYAQHFNADTGPIRTMIVVKRLPHKDIRVEIEGIALARQ